MNLDLSNKSLELRYGDLLCPPHINSSLEILYVKHGRIFVKCDTEEAVLSDGEAMIILPYRIHTFEPSDDADGVVFIFSYAMAEEFYNQYNTKNMESFKYSVSTELSAYAEKMLASYNKSPNEFLEKSLFYAFISGYIENTAELPQPSGDRNALRDVVEYIYLRINEDITLTGLASALGLSQSAVRNIFKKYFGITFNEFVANIRLENAISLILSTNLSVTEIAYLSGFGSLRNFNRLFIKRVGCTPSEYRKRYIEYP